MTQETRGPSPLDFPFEPVGEDGEATVFACGLCGTRFTHWGRTCGSCPLSAGCDIVKCPHCGYQFPRGSILLRWLRRLRRS